MAIAYSRVVEVEIINFMTLEHVVVKIDDAVINLVGYNDSGKSAFTRSLEVVLTDNYSTEQANFVQWGKEYFIVRIKFDDGVVIEKQKYGKEAIKAMTGKSIWTMTKNGELVYTNRLKEGSIAINEVPQEIALYLNILVDEHTGEQLNIRRRDDRLFLINTSGGDNYKIINSVLKAEVATETTKILNEEKNKLISKVSQSTTSVLTLENESTLMKVISIEDEQRIEEVLNQLKGSRDKLNLLTGIVNVKEELDGIVVNKEVQGISLERVHLLGDLIQLKEEKNTPVQKELVNVDLQKLTEVGNLVNLNEERNIRVNKEVGLIDTSNVYELQALINNYKEKNEEESKLTQLEGVLEQKKARLKQLSDEHGLKVCPNCETLVG